MDELIEHPKSRFLKVECRNCSNTQVIFDHASTRVGCLVCDAELAEPTGGKVKLKAKVIRSF